MDFKYSKNDVNICDENNNTPLFYAASNGNYNFCKFLIDLGSDVNYVCSKGNTPLHMAFSSQKLKVFKLLTHII